MSSVYGKVYGNILFRETLTPDFGSGVFDALSDDELFKIYENGTAAGKVDLVFADTRQLAASGTESLDFAGALLTPGGRPFLPLHVNAISIYAHVSNVNDVLVGGAASNGLFTMFGDATDVVKVKPGGLFLWADPGAGAVVVATTADLLKITNGGAGTVVDYDIKVLGRST